jgi:choice-of-anchor B domain-containing protein
VNCSASVPNWAGTVGYVHDIYVEDGIAYCNAGGNGLYIVDFTDPSDPQIIGDLTDYDDSGYNHSGWLHPDGQYYALADETHGMRIKLLDVSDPSDIQVVNLFGVDIAPQSIPHNLIFEGDYLHVSYYFDGYYVFDISDPLNVEIVAFYDTSTVPHSSGYKGAWGVYPFMSDGKVLVSDMQEGLFVLQPDIASGVSESRNTAVSVYPNPIQGN